MEEFVSSKCHGYMRTSHRYHNELVRKLLCFFYICLLLIYIANFRKIYKQGYNCTPPAPKVTWLSLLLKISRFNRAS
jgi:hypothetical protein